MARTRSRPPVRALPPMVRDGLRDLAALALPTSCGGCGQAGTAWCGACADALSGVRLCGPRPTEPVPCPPGMPLVWAAGPYAGPLRGALVAYKDGDRRDLRRVLAPLLAEVLVTVLTREQAVRAAIRADQRVWLVPVPSSSASVRRRGDLPLGSLLHQAIPDVQDGLRPPAPVEAPCLRLVRRVADQAGLDHQERAANLLRAMAIRPRWRSALPGSVCVVVDDVVTTGATLVEAARALRAGGAELVVAASLAATQRRAIVRSADPTCPPNGA